MSEQRDGRRVAVVTGAGGGLGAEIAVRLAHDGFDLALLDINEQSLGYAVQLVAETGRRALAMEVDLTQEAAVEDAFATIDREFARLDALVSAAGGSGTHRIRSLRDVTGDVWRRVLDANLTSAFLCARSAVPLMSRNGYGRIVNFSSAVAQGKAGPSGTVGARLPYAASKAAVEGLTKQLAKDTARTGITVNAIAPGLIIPNSGRVRDSFEAQSEEAKAATRASIPVGRTGTGAEIAAAVSYLVSESAGFTTGAVLRVDGAEV